MLVVLEGPRNVGKTVIARGLCDKLDENYLVELVHHEYGDTTPEKLSEDLAMAYQEKNKVFVFDRWYLSEYVYIKIRDENQYPPTMPLGLSLDAADWIWGEKADDIGCRVLLMAGERTLLRRIYSDNEGKNLEEEKESVAIERSLYMRLTSANWERVQTDAPLGEIINRLVSKVNDTFEATKWC